MNLTTFEKLKNTKVEKGITDVYFPNICRSVIFHSRNSRIENDFDFIGVNIEDREDGFFTTLETFTEFDIDKLTDDNRLTLARKLVNASETELVEVTR